MSAPYLAFALLRLLTVGLASAQNMAASPGFEPLTDG